MRSKEERVSRIEEKMRSKKKPGMQGEKAQEFKDKYTEDVKSAAKRRRGKKHHNEQMTDENRQKRQDYRKSEREKGMSAAQQRNRKMRFG